NREVGEEMNTPRLPGEESVFFGDASAISGLARAEAEVIEGGPIVSSLGQIFISIPTARRNAKTMKQSLEEELQFLFVHGLLHLLGFDHQTPEQEKEMLKYAYKILGR
ncbi:MAG: rRNA maturation RNase YbeY, partial [Candidatus Gracilibacteria bacterium]